MKIIQTLAKTRKTVYTKFTMSLDFQVMLKPRGALCNLNCAYCYFLSKARLYPQSAFRMSDALLETYTRQYIAAHAALGQVTFAWQGGEPTLMGLEFFRRAIELQTRYAPAGMRVVERDVRAYLAAAPKATPLAEKLAAEAGIDVGFEAGDLPFLKYVADRVNGWGINLDIGHAYMIAGSDEGFFAYLDEFAGKVVEVHHNGVNHYWGRYMEHQPPHMNNMIDFQTTYERLRDMNYEGPIVCEIQGHDIEQVIAHCRESRDMIVGIWEGRLRMKNRWYIPD